MCYNCLVLELKIKSYFIQNKIPIYVFNKIIAKYDTKCFANNKYKIINYILKNLELNSNIIKEIDLLNFIDNITNTEQLDKITNKNPTIYIIQN
jgi:hypothetical protein